MKHLVTIAFALAVLGAHPASADDRAIALGGTLRAVYLASNPAQAVQDRATGAIRGASVDLARELGRRMNMPVEIKPVANPKAVIDAVSGGDADIDRKDQKIAGTFNDSITLFMKQKLRNAALREIANDPAEIKRLLLAKEIDAFGANRQRLINLMKDTPGLRLLPDSLFGVPQTIIVPKGKADVLAAVNRFIDDVRASGLLQRSIENSGVVGLEVAPAGSWQPSVPD